MTEPTTPPIALAGADARQFDVRLLPSGRRFAAGADTTLLAAALAAGVPMPNSCRNGTCRACLCRLVSGQIAYRIEWPGLSADEKREGYILPCVAHPQSDLIVGLTPD